jgi:hypothetical protein
VNRGKCWGVRFCGEIGRVYINMELILTIGVDNMLSRLVQMVTLGLNFD